jgi:hypothetical protein
MHLLLQPSGRPSHYEGIANGRIVGRIIMLHVHRNPSTPWVWSIELPFRENRTPTYGYAATREAVMEALARSWGREI